MTLNYRLSYRSPVLFMQEVSEREGTETCEICYCGFEREEGGEGRPAGICYGCWLQHIKTFTSQISYKAGSEIISPFEGRDPLDVGTALRTLLPTHQEELHEFLFKKYSAFTADIEKCPSEACDYVFTSQACRWGGGQQEKCPKCEAVLWQRGGWDFKSIIGFVYFLFLTSKCPKCEIPIEKTTGCPHMSCPCGHQFCWYCLKDYYPSPANVYSVHEPKECVCIVGSKVIFTLIFIAGAFLTLLGNQIFQRFMGYFFVGMAYLLHTLILDLIIAVNIFVVNSLLVRYYNRNFFMHRANRFAIAALLLFDCLVLYLLYYFQLMLDSAIILLAEVTLAGFIAGTVWLVTVNVETWFKYIC